MQRELRQTADGSHTLALPGTDITYHSHHGAIAESRHVFIEAGLAPVLSNITNNPVHVFEMGLGTGLNALLTLLTARKEQRKIYYTAFELFPLTEEEAASINYGQLLDAEAELKALHNAAWETAVTIDPFFTIQKQQQSLLDTQYSNGFHCIYFDAFAPGHQPELWTRAVFEKLFGMMEAGGILVTYCSKTEVRRAMTTAGFSVEKIPGPRGKREMVRAKKD